MLLLKMKAHLTGDFSCPLKGCREHEDQDFPEVLHGRRMSGTRLGRNPSQTKRLSPWGCSDKAQVLKKDCGATILEGIKHDWTKPQETRHNWGCYEELGYTHPLQQTRLAGIFQDAAVQSHLLNLKEKKRNVPSTQTAFTLQDQAGISEVNSLHLGSDETNFSQNTGRILLQEFQSQ